MLGVWDYDPEELKKTEQGRILLLERMIDYGVSYKYGPKIKLAEVKKNWDKLRIEPDRRELLKLLIWGS